MIEFDLFNIVFEYMNDNEFMYICSIICKNDIFQKRRNNIYKLKCIQSLHHKLMDYKDLDFDYDFDSNNKIKSHTLNMIRIMVQYLFLDGILEPKYKGHCFVKYKHYEQYVSTPTLMNLIKQTDLSPKELLDFSEKVKKPRIYNSLCQIYRMPRLQRTMLIKHYPYAKALIY